MPPVEFQRDVAQPVKPTEGIRSPFLLKLFFGDFTSTDRIKELIHEHQHETQALLTHLQRCEIEAAPDDLYALLTIRYGILRAQATLAWIEEVEETLAPQARIP